MENMSGAELMAEAGGVQVDAFPHLMNSVRYAFKHTDEDRNVCHTKNTGLWWIATCTYELEMSRKIVEIIEFRLRIDVEVLYVQSRTLYTMWIKERDVLCAPLDPRE